MRRAIFLGLVLALATCAFAQEDTRKALERGLLEEESNQNLDAAIREYQTVVSRYDALKPTAATALFRIAESYRKLGRTDEARRAYERLVREFPEQTKLVELSRRYLPADVAPGQAPTDTRARQAELLREEIGLLEQQIASERKRIEIGVAGTERLTRLSREVLELKRQLVALEAKPAPM